MRLLVSGTLPTMYDFAAIPEWRPYLGHLVVPRNRNRPENYKKTGLPIFCDNGAFGHFDAGAWARMLHEYLDVAGWFTMPDVVGCSASTFGLWDWWCGQLGPYVGIDLADLDWSAFPMAFVAQDGMEDGRFDWDLVWHCGFINCFFLGGTTEWKLSRAAADLVQEAKRHGWQVHMGRVNSVKRIRYAAQIGCDSVDGSCFSMFGRTYIPMAVKALMEIAGDANARKVVVAKRSRRRAA